MTTKNELGRYLTLTIPHLLAFCDEVRVVDDHSDDGTFEWLQEQDGVVVKRNDGPTWSEHEGKLRGTLFDFTMEGRPDVILASDADELVTDGEALRRGVEASPRTRSFMLRMCEVWKRDGEEWMLRMDGGWVAHDVAIVYRVPPNPRGSEWAAWPRRMAAGRVPRGIHRDARHGRAVSLGVDIFHLGWSNPDERAVRYQRYVELDGGEFHAKAHLDSIMWPDEKVTLEACPAPAGL